MLASQAFAEVCESKLSGHFVEVDKVGHIYVRHVPAPLEEATHCDEVDFRTMNFTLYYGAPSQHAEKLNIADEVLNTYAYTDDARVCRDPESGLDQLVMTRSQGGTAAGDSVNVLFVFYDREKQGFSSEAFEGRFAGKECSLAKTRARYQLAEDKRLIAEKLYQRLQPPAQSATHFSPKVVEFDFQHRYEFLKQQKDSGEVAIQLDVMAENKRWRIVVIYFEEDLDRSWGVLFAEDKVKGKLISFYDVPKGDSSKRYLFLPSDVSLDGDTLNLNLCTNCSWWGEYAAFTVNLNRFAYEHP